MWEPSNVSVCCGDALLLQVSGWGVPRPGKVAPQLMSPWWFTHTCTGSCDEPSHGCWWGVTWRGEGIWLVGRQWWRSCDCCPWQHVGSLREHQITPEPPHRVPANSELFVSLIWPLPLLLSSSVHSWQWRRVQWVLTRYSRSRLTKGVWSLTLQTLKTLNYWIMYQIFWEPCVRVCVCGVFS